MHRFRGLYHRQSVTVAVEGYDLALYEADSSSALHRFSISRLQVSLVGDNTHQFAIRSPEATEPLIVDSKLLLQLLADKGCREAESVLARSETKTRLKIIAWGLPIALVAFLLVLTPLMFTYLPDQWTESLVSRDQEQDLAAQFVPYLTADLKIDESSAAAPKVQKLLDLIQDANPQISQHELTVAISDLPMPNAFALFGGRLFVTKDLIKKSDSLSELAGVLGHEMAHDQYRHGFHRLISQSGQASAMVALSLFIGPDAAFIIYQGTSWLSLKYSRDQESEADRAAVTYLQNAQIPAQGLITFFKKLEIDNPSDFDFLSTHPAPGRRAQELQELIGDQSLHSSQSLEERLGFGMQELLGSL